MREKTLDMIAHVYGPFEKLVSITIEGLDDADPDTLPQELRDLRAFIVEKLTAGRTAYEDAVVPVAEAALNETEIDDIAAFHKSDTQQKLVIGGLLNPALTGDDVDAIATFLKSPSGTKFREASKSLQENLQQATALWRNATLEPHREEINKILSVIEPAPIEDSADGEPVVSTSEPPNAA